MKSISKEAGEAFAQLVREHQKSVFALAYGKLRNSHDAEDVMQEVFVEAYRNFHKLNNHNKVSGWLFRATVYRCKDHFRKKSRRWRREMEFADSHNPGKDEQTHSDRSDAVLEAIGRLPEKYRVVVMLKHFAGLSYKDISSMTGLSKTTIDGRLRMAKKELREMLLEMDPGVS